MFPQQKEKVVKFEEQDAKEVKAHVYCVITEKTTHSSETIES